jgi:FkbM family methyltransferase
MDNGLIVREAKRALRSVIPTPILNWREAQYFGRYGEVELQLTPYLCRADRDSIDIGANDGCYVHFLRKHSTRVIAFEPIPALASNLAKKFSHGVVIQNMALSRSAGTAMLRIPLLDDEFVSGCSTISPQAALQYPAYREIPVPMDTLDNVYDGDVGFIKIDVEGHEEAVLDGARRTIARCRPRMLVENDERLTPGGVRRIADFFRGFDFSGFFVFERRLVAIDQFDPAVLQRRENLPDLKATLDRRERFGRYIYNFLFLPNEDPPETFRDMEAQLAQL